MARGGTAVPSARARSIRAIPFRRTPRAPIDRSAPSTWRSTSRWISSRMPSRTAAARIDSVKNAGAHRVSSRSPRAGTSGRASPHDARYDAQCFQSTSGRARIRAVSSVHRASGSAAARRNTRAAPGPLMCAGLSSPRCRLSWMTSHAARRSAASAGSSSRRLRAATAPASDVTWRHRSQMPRYRARNGKALESGQRLELVAQSRRARRCGSCRGSDPAGGAPAASRASPSGAIRRSGVTTPGAK